MPKSCSRKRTYNRISIIKKTRVLLEQLLKAKNVPRLSIAMNSSGFGRP